jgi:hypothetical protein
LYRLKTLSITITISFLLFNSGYPIYRDGTLIIPRVDTDAQAGNFQDTTFQFDSVTNTWRLLDYKETALVPGQRLVPDAVEVLVTDSSPIQVFLKVSGSSGPVSPCSEFGQINQRLDTNRFEITIHVVTGLNDFVCAAMAVPYEKIIPLEVYGLPAGTYEYSVNGEHTGTFSLTRDNTL